MKDTLKVYQRQRGRTSFLSTMLETVEELKQSGTYPQDLEALRDQERDPRLAAKLRDIAGIYGAYGASGQGPPRPGRCSPTGGRS